LRQLLSDTEIGKDISEEVFSCDLTCDFAEVVECLSDVDGDEVG
jgi:hypothetical protein